MNLRAEDFHAFFVEVHGHAPFPWQSRLLAAVAAGGRWPPVLDLPTGSGKTAAIDIAVFHLALQAELGRKRNAPVRIAFIVDRRLVVDDAYARARRIEEALRSPKGPITDCVAARLRSLSADETLGSPPLLARRLRGGIPRESDWARTPSQPTVLCSTVDQIGSRLLFRGYGVSDSMKPVHAGLIGSDCLILLDEAHLAEPFKQTLGWIAAYHGPDWREAEVAAPWSVSLLTATPGDRATDDPFGLTVDDIEHPVLSLRLRSAKPVRLVKVGRERNAVIVGALPTITVNDELEQRVRAIVAEAKLAWQQFADPRAGASAPAIAIVVNRIARARAVHAALERELEGLIASEQLANPILMIGAARSIDRDDLAEELAPIRTRTWNPGEQRRLDRAMIIVATQCIEAGVDIDLDALITEAAPIDALKQRFGRLNRAGRDVTVFASIVATNSELAARYEDPVYGVTIRHAWDYLSEIADKTKPGPPTIDFGLNAWSAREQANPVPAAAISKKSDAPILLPAHVDLLSQTSPLPAVDPDVALYLHGPDLRPDAVSVVWRADVDAGDAEVRALLALVPPRSSEAVELPVWAVRRWLIDQDRVDLADVAAEVPAEATDRRTRSGSRRVFLWRGDTVDSRWIMPGEVRPGMTIVVSAGYGGLDRFGWEPGGSTVVADVGRKAARPFSGRRFSVRVAPGLLDSSNGLTPDLAAAIGDFREARWSEMRNALLTLSLPQELRDDLVALDRARRRRVVMYTDLHGEDQQGRPRGVVFSAPLGLEGGSSTDDFQPSSTEDDMAGSLPGYSLSLETHSADVERFAESFAKSAGLPDTYVADLKLAGYLHDLGKADVRFQAWLQYGDPLVPGPSCVLAKSARPLPRKARSASGLPDHWRHEALSVRKARSHDRLAGANDPMLVLWLVGTHHGFGRPFFPHLDPQETLDDIGPQSLAFQWRGLDWTRMFEHLRKRYGVWELARMEAIVRLADHRASEVRADGEGDT